MTPAQTTLRSRVLQVFGPTEYENIRETATFYLLDNNYIIPPAGVEAMPEYWEAVEVLMQDVLRTQK